MGFMESLGFGHHQEEAAPVAQAEQPEVPTGAMDTGEAVAAAATTGEATQSVEGVDVKSAGTDMVVGGGEAVINLKDAEVHPAEVGEEKPEGGAATNTMEDELGAATDMQSGESETAVPVVTDSPGEFSTAVPLKGELTTAEPSEGGVSVAVESGESDAQTSDTQIEEVGESEQVTAEVAGNQDAGSSEAEDAAAMLKKFQDELGQATETGGEANSAGDMPATSVESTDSDAEEAVSGGVSMDSAAKKDAIDPDVLNERAADEAADIAARFDEMNSGAETKPEIHAMGGEIPAETTDEAGGSEVAKPQNEATTTEQEPVITSVEDESFPAPPVEDGADKPGIDAGESVKNEAETNAGVIETNADTNESDSSVIVDGGDVHLDRAKYLEQEEPSADDEPGKQVQGEAVGAEVFKLPVADRTALEDTAADLERQARSIRELLDRAA